MNVKAEKSSINKIVKRIRGKGRGCVVFQSDFADCGTPFAIKSAFHRMLVDGMLVRLAQGIYLYPKIDTELGLGVIYPSIEEIAEAIARRDKAKIAPTGAYALNRLGFSTQVPMNVVFLTSGTARKIKVGNGRGILFKHSSSGRNFDYRSELMLLIITAMRELGKEGLTDEERRKVKEMKSSISLTDFNHDVKLAPAWIRTILMQK